MNEVSDLSIVLMQGCKLGEPECGLTAEKWVEAERQFPTNLHIKLTFKLWQISVFYKSSAQVTK